MTELAFRKTNTQNGNELKVWTVVLWSLAVTDELLKIFGKHHGMVIGVVEVDVQLQIRSPTVM